MARCKNCGKEILKNKGNKNYCHRRCAAKHADLAENKRVNELNKRSFVGESQSVLI